MKLSQLTLSLATAIVISGAAPAMAASTATGVLTGWSFQLIDLDLTDGITPDIVFSNPFSLSGASAQGQQAEDVLVPGAFADGVATINGLLGQALGATSPGGNLATGSATGDAGALVEFSAIGLVFGEFALTPMTGIVITADFIGTAETTLGSDGVRSEAAGAIGLLGLDVLTNGVVDSYSSSAEVFAGAVYTGAGFTGESDSFVGLVTLSYDNLSSATQFGTTSAYAYAYGGSALPVPEPQTLLMMLAGLAAVGGIARRGRRGA